MIRYNDNLVTREQAMVWMRVKDGMTLQQIGDEFGLTRERVRQILADQGVTGTPWTGYKPLHYRRLAQTVARVAQLVVQNARPDDEHYPHGTVNGYMRGCTCDDCRTANRERVYAHKGITVKTPHPRARRPRTDGTRRAALYYRERDDA